MIEATTRSVNCQPVLLPNKHALDVGPLPLLHISNSDLRQYECRNVLFLTVVL